MLRLLESQRVRPRSRTLPPPSSLSLVPLARPPASRRPAPREPGLPSRSWRQSPVERRARRGRSLLGSRLDRRADGQPRVRRAGPPARLRLPKRLPLEAVLAAAIVAVLLAFLWSRQPLRRDPLLLPADAAGAVLAYEASLAADEPAPPPEAPGLAPPPDRLPQRVLESLKVATYEVKPGDTISTIAGRFSLNLDTLLSYNDVRDVRRLTAGRVLKVPNSDGLKHRVSRGESLGGIAGRYGIELNSLLDWNSLESSVIRPGQELFIPGGRLPSRELDRILGKLFIYPTQGRLSSGFGVRPDPFTGIRRFHNGLDLANSQGTPVRAAMTGRVAMVGYNANFGKYIILSHSDGYQTLYGHLDEFLVARGQAVKQGQAIGRMGNTGYSTGPHLHFSVFHRGEPVNPSRFLN